MSRAGRAFLNPRESHAPPALRRARARQCDRRLFIAHVEVMISRTGEGRQGAMILIDEKRAETLYGARVPPGSSRRIGCQHGVGAASLGASAGFIGRFKADETGGCSTRIRAVGVAFRDASARRPGRHGALLHSGHPGRPAHPETPSWVACQNRPSPTSQAPCGGSAIVILEGYMWAPPADKGGLRQGGGHRAIGRQPGWRSRFDLVGFLLTSTATATSSRTLMRSRTVDHRRRNESEIARTLSGPTSFEARSTTGANEGRARRGETSADGSTVVTRADPQRDAFPIARLVE